MAGDTSDSVGLRGEEASGLRRFVRSHAEELVVGYPVAVLTLLFVVPLVLLLATSVYPKPSGGYYEIGFTLEHYRRLFTTPLYLERIAFTIGLAAGTAFVCLAIGYPIAYTLARMESAMRRRVYITAIVSTMWLTYIIRSYAWTVILSESGVLSNFLRTVGLVDGRLGIAPGFWALVIGMTYVFLPFAVLTMYSSVNNINPELEEASKNLGADRYQTFRRVVLPLSKNGIYASWMLVFILGLGAYIVPKILGKPAHWTLPVTIGDQITEQLNVPFGAALAVVMIVIVFVILAVGYTVLNVGGDELAGGSSDV